MFEDNPYFQKIRQNFGTEINVEAKINNMLGKTEITDIEKTE